MKLLNKKQKNNKGFSLVELIVVIAIMVVLVAVLAPVFTKYIESSRRSTDVQNANAIAEAVLADVADGKFAKGATTDQEREVAGTKPGEGNETQYLPSAIAKQPEVKGNVVENATTFRFVYHPSSNECDVYVKGDSTYNLSIEGDGSTTNKGGASGYKNAEKGSVKSSAGGGN